MRIISLVVTILMLLSAFSSALAAPNSKNDQILEDEAAALGYSAYTWGLVYVKSMLLRDQAVNPNYHGYSPINNIYTESFLAKPGFTDFTPNNDTLYGLGWLDLSKGPILMTVPKSDSRYWVMQATDYGLNTIGYVGSRLKSKPGVYAYARADWKGTLPEGVQRINSRSNTVFLQLRTFVNQSIDGDLEKVVKFNRSFSFTPLDKQAVYAAVSKDTKFRDVKNTNPDLHGLKFFNLLNEAVTREQPIPGEEAIYAQFAKYGIGPGKTFNPDTLTESQRRGLQKGIKAAVDRIILHGTIGGKRLGGFTFHYGLGDYGFDFLLRSMVAFFGYGANTGEEAMYPSTFTDDRGQFFNGSNKYLIHFDKDKFPPVDAFWSITMYHFPDNQLVENSIDRYNINNTIKGLKYEKDGSLNIYVQHEKPSGDQASNWLPAPKDGFWFILRMYVPQKDVLEGKYIAPKVEFLGAK